MLCPASVKGVILSKENASVRRSPEHVERVWDEAVDGAWAPGKAPVTLLSEFLQHVQDEDVEQAELTAREILSVEPNYQLVKDLVAAMKQQQELEDQLESEEESDEDDDEEGEEDEELDSEEEEEDESPEVDRDEK